MIIKLILDCAAVEPIIRQVNEVSLNAGAGRHCILKKKIKISEAVAAVKTLTSLKFLNLALAKGASLGILYFIYI